MARESTPDTAPEAWPQRFELQSSAAALLTTLLGLALRTTDEGEPDSISSITLNGAYVWSALSVAIALLFLALRLRRRDRPASATLALVIALAALALHHWLQPEPTIHQP
ncbi:MAG: hypothetical protein IT454_05710 [Planctomycetes bacterium]|nr:hypothetical protein [Planctomycetota bacterium]